MTECPPQPVFDIAATSGFYAQMTGLLAGFAFSAIIVILWLGKEHTRPKGVILTLLSAFISLVLSTLTYSVLAGDSGAYTRAAAQELVDAIPFVLAVMMLFHGLTQLLMGSPNPEATAVKVSRSLSAVITPTLAIFYLASGAVDNELARTAARRVSEPTYCGDLGPMTTFSIALLGALLIVLLVLWFVPPPRHIGPKLSQRASVVPLTTLWVSIGVTLSVGVITLQRPDFQLPSWAVVGFLSSTWLLLVFLATFILWARPPDTTASTSSGEVVGKVKQSVPGT